MQNENTSYQKGFAHAMMLSISIFTLFFAGIILNKTNPQIEQSINEYECKQIVMETWRVGR